MCCNVHTPAVLTDIQLLSVNLVCFLCVVMHIQRMSVSTAGVFTVCVCVHVCLELHSTVWSRQCEAGTSSQEQREDIETHGGRWIDGSRL